MKLKDNKAAIIALAITVCLAVFFHLFDKYVASLPPQERIDFLMGILGAIGTIWPFICLAAMWFALYQFIRSIKAIQQSKKQKQTS